MPKLLTTMILTALLLGNQAFAGDTHLWFSRDVKGDISGFVEMENKYNDLARSVIGKNVPDVRIYQSTYAGSATGSVRPRTVRRCPSRRRRARR